jgi:hypothetical protein
VRVGDLVRYPGWNEVGVIVREIPGTERRKVVHWSVSGMASHAKRDLRGNIMSRVINKILIVIGIIAVWEHRESIVPVLKHCYRHCD